MAVSVEIEQERVRFRVDPLHRVRRFGGTILIALAFGAVVVLAMGKPSGFQAALLVLGGAACGGLGVLVLLFRLGVQLDRGAGEMEQSLGFPFPLFRQRCPLGEPSRVWIEARDGGYPIKLEGEGVEHRLGTLYEYPEARRLAEGLAAFFECELHDAAAESTQLRRPKELLETLASRLQQGKEPAPSPKMKDTYGFSVKVVKGHAEVSIGARPRLAQVVILLPLVVAFVFGVLAPFVALEWAPLVMGAFALGLLTPAVLYIDPHARAVAFRSLSRTEIRAGRGLVTVTWKPPLGPERRVEENTRVLRELISLRANGSGMTPVVMIGEEISEFGEQLTPEEAKCLSDVLRAAILGKLRP